MKNFQIKSVFGACMLVLSSASFAQAYVGGDLSNTKVDGFTSASGRGVFGGYQINQYFAVEGGYRKLGSFQNYVGGPVVTINMAQLSGIGAYPINDKFKVYGRLGYGFLNKSGGSSYNIGNGVVFGAGAEFAINTSIALRAEAVKVGSDTKQYNFGVLYKF